MKTLSRLNAVLSTAEEDDVEDTDFNLSGLQDDVRELIQRQLT